MSDEPKLYREPFSYRVHFGRIVENMNHGFVVLGEEEFLSAATLAEARNEFEAWKERHKDDVTITNPQLVEVRYPQAP
ncbi:MAG: hypothetical protein KGI60_02700 [Patescibacteria group bacterium]|nr:hypothetical protein [Patescibacteria group bacterium]